MIKRFLLACIFFTPYLLHADTLTTDNLITNGTFENGNSNGWISNGDVQVLNDCCGSTYDLEFGDSGSIEQSFTLTNDNISQPMLDNGITLNSSVQVQNGECSLPGCWAGSGRGGADSFTVRLQIKDVDNNVLATTSNTRYDITDIYGSDFTDQLIYGGTGSNIGNIYISGTDANAPGNLGGANIDNVSVTMTYDDSVVTEVQAAAITESVEELNQVLELFEEVIPTEIITEEIYIQEVQELAVEIIEENFVEIKVEEEIVLAVIEPESNVEEINAENIETETGTENQEITETESAENIIESMSSDQESIETSENENDSRSSEVTVTIDDIADKVASKIQDVNKRVAVTQMIVAKIMMGKNNNAITTYSQFGNEIFENQLEMPQMSLTNEYTKDLEKDDRVIASPVFHEYRQEVDQANADLIRAKEHLRNIRGY